MYRGFTIVEVLIILVILAIIATVVTPFFYPDPRRAPVMIETETGQIRVDKGCFISFLPKEGSNGSRLIEPGDYEVVRINNDDRPSVTTIVLYQGPKSPLSYYHCTPADIASEGLVSYVRVYWPGTESFDEVKTRFALTD